MGNIKISNNYYDISEMQEDKTYRHCPYCGAEETNLPQNIEVKDDYKPSKVSFKYVVNDKEYPFEANYQYLGEVYAQCHYGVTDFWTEIHCCDKCKKEYYTVHEH